MSESSKELEVRQALQAKLDGGETLVEYLKGTVVVRIFWYESRETTPYILGLTNRRLILMPLRWNKPTEKWYSVWREYVVQMSITVGGFLRKSRLEIKLPADTLTFNLGRDWAAHAQMLVGSSTISAPTLNPASASPTPSMDRLVKQAEDFLGIGATVSAQHMFEQAVRNNPALEMDPAAGPLRQKLADVRFSMRAAAGFLLVTAIITTLSTGLGVLLAASPLASLNYETLIGVAILVVGAVQLWRGNNSGKWIALITAAFSLLADMITAVTSQNILVFVAGVGYSGAVFLALLGRPSRTRIWLSIALYVMGYLGGIALAVVIAVITAVASAQGSLRP